MNLGYSAGDGTVGATLTNSPPYAYDSRAGSCQTDSCDIAGCLDDEREPAPTSQYKDTEPTSSGTYGSSVDSSQSATQEGDTGAPQEGHSGFENCSIFTSDPRRVGNKIGGYGFQSCIGPITWNNIAVCIERRKELWNLKWWDQVSCGRDREGPQAFQEAEYSATCVPGRKTYRVVTYAWYKDAAGFVHAPPWKGVQSGTYLTTSC